MNHRRSRFLLPGLASLALALAVSAPAPARADATADQRAAAQALFDDARRLIADKRYPEACPKLEESQHLDPGLGTLLYLADCQEKSGKTASAWANFLEAAYLAKKDGQTKRENTARAHAAALEPKLSKLTILAVMGGHPVEIRRDGAVVADSLVGTAVPIDPGEHTVSASAAGKKPWESRILVHADGQPVTVSVPQLEDAAPPVTAPPTPPPVAPPPPVAEPTPAPVTPPATPPVEPPPAPPPGPPPNVSSGSGARGAGIALTIVGAGGLGVGGFFAWKAKQQYNASLTGGCTLNACDPAGTTLRNQARAYGNYATAGIIGGGVLAAGGVALLIAASVIKHRSDGNRPAVTAFFDLDPRGGGALGLKGSF